MFGQNDPTDVRSRITASASRNWTYRQVLRGVCRTAAAIFPNLQIISNGDQLQFSHPDGIHSGDNIRPRRTQSAGTMISRGPGASLSTSDLGSYGSSLQSGPISPFSSQARAVFDGTPTPSASVTASPGLVSSSTGAIAGSVIAHPASISEPMSKPRVRINGGSTPIAANLNKDCLLSPLSKTGINRIAVGARIVLEAAWVPKVPQSQENLRRRRWRSQV